MPIPDLTGRWAQFQAITSVEHIPLLGTIRTTMGVLMLLDIQQDGAAIQGTETMCHIGMRSTSSAIDVEVPTAFTQSLSGNHRTGRVVQEGRGWRLELERAWMLSGVAPNLPKDEALPTEPDDPRVRDSDKDGRPGVTLVSLGLVEGALYLAQRSWNELAGRITTPTLVRGRVTWGGERRVLDAESIFLEIEPESHPDPDPNKSIFTMVKVDPDATCSSVAARSRTLFR